MEDRGYYVRLRLPAETEAMRLAGELMAHGARVVRHEAVLAAVWPATEADEPGEWDEYTFAELIFFLRAWAGRDPRRRIDVLEERPVESGADLPRQRTGQPGA